MFLWEIETLNTKMKAYLFGKAFTVASLFRPELLPRGRKNHRAHHKCHRP